MILTDIMISRTIHLVLATGPGTPPAVQFLAGRLVRFGFKPGKKTNRIVLAGLLPGPDIKP